MNCLAVKINSVRISERIFENILSILCALFKYIKMWTRCELDPYRTADI